MTEGYGPGTTIQENAPESRSYFPIAFSLILAIAVIIVMPLEAKLNNIKPLSKTATPSDPYVATESGYASFETSSQSVWASQFVDLKPSLNELQNLVSPFDNIITIFSIIIYLYCWEIMELY